MSEKVKAGDTAAKTSATRVQPKNAIPVKQPPMLLEKTQKYVTKIESLLGHPFVAYWNSANSSIYSYDVAGLYALLQNLEHRKHISILIKSGGGDGQTSLRMVNLLREYADEITALIPLGAASAATMLALGADKIKMGPLAQLSAVDTSLRHSLSPVDILKSKVSVSQDELARVIRLWQTQAAELTTDTSNPYESLFKYVHPLVIGAVDRSSALSIRLCNEILGYHMQDKEKAMRISEELNSNYPSHGYPITLKEAKRIGLNAEPLEKEVNHLLLELNEVYSEMAQPAKTDFDDTNNHDNSIATIMECKGTQVFFQYDKDWHYRASEQRWVAFNDNSGWRKAEKKGTKTVASVLHLG